MAALRSFKRIDGPLQLILLLLLQGLVEPNQLQSPKESRPIFKCAAKYFPSTNIDIVWMKDGKQIEANKPELFYKDINGRREFSVTTNVTIPPGQGDVRSELSCQIQHKSDQQTDVLRVEPRQLQSPKGVITAGLQPTFTCSAEFFPSQNLKVVWMKDGKILPPFPPKFFRTVNGIKEYSVTNNLTIPLGKGDERSQLSCRIKHISDQKTDVLRDSQKHSVIVLCIALFLTKVAVLLFIFCLLLIKVCGCKKTKDHSGTFQEVRQSEAST